MGVIKGDTGSLDMAQIGRAFWDCLSYTVQSLVFPK